MSEPQFLVLNNAMSSKLGTFIFGYIKIVFQTYTHVIINTNHIVSVKKYIRKYDKLSSMYYIIMLTNGEKIYVNDNVIQPNGFLSVHSNANPDFYNVSQLVYSK